MEFKFEKLLIWQKAMDFGEGIFLLSKRFPKDVSFDISSQIRRASDSIALSISEGSIGQSNLEFQKFMGYSIRSLAELISCLCKSKRRQYINDIEFNEKYECAFNEYDGCIQI